MQIHEITSYLESIAPLSLQEDYDNSGLLVGQAEKTIGSALISLDVTPDVVQEAKEKGCGLIVAHHPLIFRGLKRITGSTYVERALIDAIRQDIAIYAIHTNLDNVLHNGVNGKIAEKLGLSDFQVLAGHPQGEDFGSGLVGNLAQDLSEIAFMAHIREKMEVSVIRHTRFLGKTVHRVAVCGGSGRFLLPRAISAGAQFFVSADFKYHDFFDANDRIVIADIGHFESEHFTMELLANLIRTKFPTFAAHLTTTVTNPINYYPG